MTKELKFTTVERYSYGYSSHLNLYKVNDSDSPAKPYKKRSEKFYGSPSSTGTTIAIATSLGFFG